MGRSWSGGAYMCRTCRGKGCCGASPEDSSCVACTPRVPGHAYRKALALTTRKGVTRPEGMAAGLPTKPSLRPRLPGPHVRKADPAAAWHSAATAHKLDLLARRRSRTAMVDRPDPPIDRPTRDKSRTAPLLAEMARRPVHMSYRGTVGPVPRTTTNGFAIVAPACPLGACRQPKPLTFNCDLRSFAPGECRSATWSTPGPEGHAPSPGRKW